MRGALKKAANRINSADCW